MGMIEKIPFFSKLLSVAVYTIHSSCAYIQYQIRTISRKYIHYNCRRSWLFWDDSKTTLIGAIYTFIVILYGEFRRLIYKQNNICTQSKFTDFSYEVLEQVSLQGKTD